MSNSAKVIQVKYQ